MKGVCFKCGIRSSECGTSEFPVPNSEFCGWVDDQQDLCSHCARELLAGPIDNLTDALLVIRAMRAAMFETAAHVVELVFQLGGLSRAETEPEIWTP